MTWTRLLSLRLGHTTAAASTVVAAFMGGLALGAALAGWAAPRLAPRRALQLYALIEFIVVIIAVTLPFQLDALTPLLRSAYHDGDGGALFTVMRVTTAFVVLLPPALALGASFPLAARWREAAQAGPGPLYAVNTCGAAIGAAAAGFLLLPMLGLRVSTFCGVALTLAAIGVALLLARGVPEPASDVAPALAATPTDAPRGRVRGRRAPKAGSLVLLDAPRWLAPILADPAWSEKTCWKPTRQSSRCRARRSTSPPRVISGCWWSVTPPTPMPLSRSATRPTSTRAVSPQ